ncbi:MAG TPA: MFS transporter [Pyrinomonadaceae bacterium]|jgi:OPA family glycerol-3-phosphate transporter-like MFS transporter/OPA family sugar phosphate sensor protein UhpC-like MFS transporter|nr:MFS transporter [Pyrinomonadaceae bacterium]
MDQSTGHSNSGLFDKLLQPFRSAPPASVQLTDPQVIAGKYRYWQKRVLISSIIGYATFYFVRANLPIAMPSMMTSLGFTKDKLGLFLTLHGVLYGVSKFANGFLGDRANARTFMAFGLGASALMNVFFGFSSAALVLGLLWMANGWFQGMGFPPCARLLTNWFSPKQLASRMSIWNTSHQIGGGLVAVLCGYLVVVNWRLAFFVPAAIAFGVIIFILFTLPDTPPSVGLPEVAGTEAHSQRHESRAEFRRFVIDRVFRNKYIWIVSIANFFVYTLRYAIFNWGPTILRETKHVKITHAGWMLAAFEVSGAVGAISGGWITDRFLGGRAVRVCVVYMALAGVALFAFWKLPLQSELTMTGLLGAAGFFIYGPQCMLAVAAANLATKRAAATAIGLTSIFGYASTVLSGWGLGALVEAYNWNVGFAGLIIAAAIGTLLFILAWPAKAHGYEAEARAS